MSLLPEPPPFGVSSARPTMILGRPSDQFKDHEKQYIDSQMARFFSIMSRQPGAKVFVDEVIITDLEMRRLDEQLANLTPIPQHDKQRSTIEGRRAALMSRHVEALKNLGALPKDSLLTDDAPECLADLYVRYAVEIRTRQNPVGTLSVEAAELARAKGLNVERYAVDALPADKRQAVLESVVKDGLEANSNHG